MGRVGDVLEGLDANCENNPSEVYTPHSAVARDTRFTAVDGLAGTDLATGPCGKFKRHFEVCLNIYRLPFIPIYVYSYTLEGLQYL